MQKKVGGRERRMTHKPNGGGGISLCLFLSLPHYHTAACVSRNDDRDAARVGFRVFSRNFVAHKVAGVEFMGARVEQNRVGGRDV